MSDETKPTAPNLLEAARRVVQAEIYREDPGAAIAVLLEAIRAFEGVRDKKDIAELPLDAFDYALNGALVKQQMFVNFERWLRDNRELIQRHFTGRYHSIKLEIDWHTVPKVSIHGADDPKALALALGGKWRRERGHDSTYFNYTCEKLPGLGIGAELFMAEKVETKPRETTELFPESEVAA